MQVWHIRLEADDASCVEAAMGLLDANERTRAARFVLPRDRRRYVLCHAATRRVLAAHGIGEARRLRFESGPFGRPRVIGSALDFSVSRSGDCALLAVGHAVRLGIDIEAVRDDLADAHLLAPYVEHEVPAQLTALPTVQRSQAFFWLWTRIEALAKARGVGIAVGPHPPLSLDASATRPLILPDDLGVMREWRWAELPAPVGFCAALATSGELAVPVLREFDAMASA
jgi:4'-phosphopantetheinyl transferase